MVKKIIIFLLLTGVFVGGYVYFFMLNKSHPDYEKLDADLNISVEALFNDCRDGNALKYTGKILEVYGQPTKLEKPDSVYVLVYELDEGMFGPEGVRATFLDSYKQALDEMDLQKPFMIKAYCTGYNETDVILEKASIVQP